MSDETVSILLGLKQDMGKVLQGQDNLNDHLKAVSDKATRIGEKLDNHIDSSEAHGIGTALKTIKVIGSAFAGALATFEGWIHLSRH